MFCNQFSAKYKNIYNFYVVLAKWGLFCKNDKCLGVESQTSEIVPGPFASLPQASVTQNRKYQKRKKAKSLDGT